MNYMSLAGPFGVPYLDDQGSWNNGFYGDGMVFIYEKPS